MSKKYLIAIKNLSFLYSHFWNLAEAIQREGWEVWVTAECNTSPQRVLDAGIKYVPLRVSGGLWDAYGEVQVLVDIYRVLRMVKPEVVHFIYLKNVLTGGILSRYTRTPAVLGAVTGMGTLFVDDSHIHRVVRRFVFWGIRYGFRNRNTMLAFENKDDVQAFVDAGVVPRNRTTTIPGAGLHSNAIHFSRATNSSTIILCAARMIRHKGINELIEAAHILRQRGHVFELWLAGGIDLGNPEAMTEKELRAAGSCGYIKWLGHRSDVRQMLGQVSIFCLPTYYREGLPLALVEAAAAGLPIVTTDVPGCREIVSTGVNGILVPSRDAEALAAALEYLLCNENARREMGLAARRVFEERFTLNAVLEAFNSCYEQLNVPLSLKRV